MIPIYKPYLPKYSLFYANDALQSSWISSNGKYISIVSERLQELLNVKHVLPVNNGTSATHLVAKALKYKYPNIKSIIIPNNVYIAAINSFLFDKDFYLHSLFDANVDTWNVDINKENYSFRILEGAANCAMLIVHNLGNIINVPSLKEELPNLVYIEDNCEGFLGKYDNHYAGTQSLASSISFFGNKNITSGEGGAFITNDDDVYEYIKCIHGQGQSDIKFIHSHLGYNYRMTNVQAAILLGQLELLNEIIEKKEKIFSIYRSIFKSFDNIHCQTVENNTIHSNWMFGIKIKGSDYYLAEKFFSSKGIEVRPMFYPINIHNHLENNPFVIFNSENNHSIATLLNKECVILPSYPDLSLSEIDYITSSCKEYIQEIR